MSTAELLQKIQALPTPLQRKVEAFVEALGGRAYSETPEDPFFAQVEALRDQIKAEYGVFPGALSHLRSEKFSFAHGTKNDRILQHGSN